MNLIQYFLDKNTNINYQSLTVNQVRKNIDKLVWDCISRWCSLDVLLEFENKINWDYVSCNENLSIDLIRKYQNKLNWIYISKWCSLDVLLEFEDRINWGYASENKNLSIDLIRKYQNELDWNYVSEFSSLDILLEFEDRINWKNTSMNENLSIDLVRKYKNELKYSINIMNILYLDDHKSRFDKTLWFITQCPYTKFNSDDKEYQCRYHQGISIVENYNEMEFID